ncbi:MAG: ABC transporter permease [Rhabdochlamydiaceae bacterium]|nr:ABC transporter permease [Rhabdochlamydiaceae bacterium]
MKRILALIRKELIGVWRDPKSRMSLLAPPLVQLLIFTFAATLDVKNVSMGVLNLDSGEKGFELIERFQGSPTFSHITYLQSEREIPHFMDVQKGLMVLYIDSTFSRDVDGKKEATVELILDGRKSNTAQIVMGYANTIISAFSKEVSALENKPIENIALVPRNWFNPNLLYYWFNIPSLVATLSMITALVVTSISIARERELGTFDQLLVSPLVPREILLGKIIPGIIIGVLEGLFMWVMGSLVFQIPFTGSFLLFLLSLIVFITAISGIGLFISSISSTQQQAMLGTFVFMVPSILLSGFATPVENMPSWLEWVSYGSPLRYMLVISKGIFLKAMPAHDILSNLWPMALIACVTCPGAALYFRRKVQ